MVTELVGTGGPQTATRLMPRMVLAAVTGLTAICIAGCTSDSHHAAQHTPSESHATAPMSMSTASPRGGEGALPQHFEIQYGDLISDCHVSGDSVSCTETQKNLGRGQSYTGTMTGKVSGMTVTGDARTVASSPVPQSPECTGTNDISGPISYNFRSDGTASARWGPYQWIFTDSCLTSQPPPNSGLDPNSERIFEWTATWSPIT